MEKKVKVASVVTVPARNHVCDAASRRFRKCRVAPAKKTSANTSSAAATTSPKSATQGAGKPAEAKYFWNCAKRSRPTHKKWAPPTILSITLKSQNSVQYARMPSRIHGPVWAPNREDAMSKG